MLAAHHPADDTRSPSPPSHLPTNAYTTGLPAPPRILIPPPSLNPLDSIQAPEWQQPSLQNMVLQCESVLPGTLQDWRYEYRRDAQQLLPHLFLGPLASTKNVAFIRNNNITLLLAVRTNMTARARLLSTQLPGVRYESIDVASTHELISQFPRAQQIIDAHYIAELPADARGQLITPLDGRVLRTFQEQWMIRTGSTQPPGGRTLLFCESGNERSAAVAAAYIMQHLGGTTIQAIQMVQAKRFCVCFDDAMKWMLMNYDPIWKARKMQQQQLLQQQQQQEQHPNNDSLGNRRKSKRKIDDDDDEEEIPMGGRAPFLDHADDIEMV